MSLLLVMVVVRARIHFVRELIAPALRSHPHPRSPIRPPPCSLHQSTRKSECWLAG